MDDEDVMEDQIYVLPEKGLQPVFLSICGRWRRYGRSNLCVA